MCKYAAMLKKAKRIVIKIGSSLIAGESGKLRDSWIESLIADIVALREAGKEVLLVSSGAVALGRQALDLSAGKKLKLEEKQAAAACGQVELIRKYQQHLEPHRITAAQILLTIEDSENRRRYLNARNTMGMLLSMGALPIINENDTVATAELRFGDNDRLAARVAQMMGADLLILFSDIDGLYTENPQLSKTAKHIPVVDVITKNIEKMAGGAVSATSSGGMITKIIAAKIAVGSGCHTMIAKGISKHPIAALLNGGKHTLFTATESPKNARKRWIADALAPAGEITIDDGAEAALLKGKSLLPAGVKSVKGDFARGDAIVVKSLKGKAVARGLCAYAATDIQKILGMKTDRLEEVLGYKGRAEIIHRDDLVLTP